MVETGRTLRERFNGHKADVRLSKRTNVAVHVDGSLCNFEQHCKLYPIEEISDTLSQEANKKLKLEREKLKIVKVSCLPQISIFQPPRSLVTKSAHYSLNSWKLFQPLLDASS